MPVTKEGNGLRGIASTLVVISHIARAFAPFLFDPAPGPDTPPHLLQYPFIRILVQGRIGVSIFALVTGYVCVLKPLRILHSVAPGTNNGATSSKQHSENHGGLLDQHSQPEKSERGLYQTHEAARAAALRSISSSAIRRIPRLVLPAVLATLLAWTLSQVGAFSVAQHSDSWWAGATSPAPDTGDSFLGWAWAATKGLISALVGTWTGGGNKYDGNQWTLLPLLRCSLWAYGFVLATISMREGARIVVAAAMWVYFWIASDSAFGMQVFWGIFLCTLQTIQAPRAALPPSYRRTLTVIGAFFLLEGLVVASYPEGHPEYTTWSSYLQGILKVWLPANADFPRFASGIGLELITFGLHCLPLLREKVLANRWLLWLGRHSFAVYLLHGPLLRSTLCWMVYGRMWVPEEWTATIGEGGGEAVQLEFPGYGRLALVLPFWIVLNYGAAVAWTRWVDPLCARATEWCVGLVVERGEEDERRGRAVLPL